MSIGAFVWEELAARILFPSSSPHLITNEALWVWWRKLMVFHIRSLASLMTNIYIFLLELTIMPISHTANFGSMELHRSQGVIVHKVIDIWTSRLVMHYIGVMKLQWCKINCLILVVFPDSNGGTKSVKG